MPRSMMMMISYKLWQLNSTQIYIHPTFRTSFFISSCFLTILDIHKTMLEASITLEDTINSLFNMRNYKYLAQTDTISFFFQSQWKVVGQSLQEFLRFAILDLRWF